MKPRNIKGGCSMNKQDIMSRVDHTILATTATWEQVKKICD